METKLTQFFFKATTRKDADDKPVKDADGKIIKDPARETISAPLPVYNSAQDIQEILTRADPKEIALLLETMNTATYDQAKAIIDDEYDVVKEAKEIPLDEKGINRLSWNAIANMPPGTRKGAAIPEEVWDAFEADYVTVITMHGKTADQAKFGAKILRKKFAAVKTHKKAIEQLAGNLHVWFSNTANTQDFEAVYQNLISKANTLLAADADAIVAAL